LQTFGNAASANVPADFVCFCASLAEHEQNAAKLKYALDGHDAVGAQVVLIHGGKIADIYCFGYAHRADKIKVDQDTLFRIASVTKMVSAIGVLKLWEDGLFDLDADLNNYFDFSVRSPFYKSEPITIRQIMTHTASLADDGHYKRALNGDVVRLESVFNGPYASGNFTKLRPGTVYDYSNFGGGLLGSVIDRKSVV
jgi:CubicO group peptidase (beta-lactamase class C family)